MWWLLFLNGAFPCLSYLCFSPEFFFTRIFIITTAGVKCCVAAVKSPRHHFSVIFFSGPSVAMSQIHLVSSTAEADAGDVRDVALFIVSHEQTLQFSFFSFGLVALEGWAFHQNIYPRYAPDKQRIVSN